MKLQTYLSAVAVILVVAPLSPHFAMGQYLPKNIQESAPGCPAWTFEHNSSGIPLEHTDRVCDRELENDPARIESLQMQLQRSVRTGRMRLIKDEKTWICPLDEKPLEEEGDEEGPLIGPESVWIFRNEASTPVVVSWFDTRRDHLEVSPYHPDIHPAHHDPHAILVPGEWTSLRVFMGHTFNVRELISVGSELVPGRVLLRHRPGAIPVRNQHAGQACPLHALVDADPKLAQPDPHTPKQKQKQEIRRIKVQKEKYKRTPMKYNRLCNSLQRVFINRAGCPIDIYFAGVAGEGHMPSSFIPENNGNPRKNKQGLSKPISPNLCNSCFEKFKFHLGVNPSHSTDFDTRWDSPVAFESTLLGHKFVARLRHNPGVVVDEFIIDRTVIRDCLNRKERAEYKKAMNEGVREGLGQNEVKGLGEINNEALKSFTYDCTLNVTAKNTTKSVVAESITSGVVSKNSVASPYAVRGKALEFK